MDKNEYLKLRSEIIQGNLNDQSMKLFYEYWKEFKKEDYKDQTEDEFKASFSQYLSYGVNYSMSLNTIIPYYDNRFHVVTVTGQKGEVLTVY